MQTYQESSYFIIYNIIAKIYKLLVIKHDITSTKIVLEL